jgi:hypothetical protein
VILNAKDGRQMGFSGAPVSSLLPHQRSKAEWLSLPSWLTIIGLFALHAPLGLVLKERPAIGAVLALACLGLGLFFAMFDKTPRRAVLVAAYITGAEILWRMTEVPISWEFGKYAASLILIVSMVNHLNLGRLPVAPLVYGALLIPSAFLAADWADISYNLSGPLGLAVATIFFSRIRLTEPHLHRILLTMISPLVGVAAIASFSTATADDLVFTTWSMKQTSGGWSPNQISGVLGLGVAVIFLCVMSRKPNKIKICILSGVAIWFAIQSALTLSRGGLLLAGATIAVAVACTVRVPRVRRHLVLVGVGGGVLALLLIVPLLQDFTGGALLSRFSSLDSTHRDVLAWANISAFLEHPVLGLGVGGTPAYNAKFGFPGYRPHTEYTRLLGEHGLFGVVALLMMAVMAWPRFFRAGLPSSKVYSAALTTWAMLYMAYNGMRFEAVSFLFGLAGAAVLTQKHLLVHTLRQHQRELSLSNLEPDAEPIEAV